MWASQLLTLSSLVTAALQSILPPVSQANRQIFDTLKSLDIPLLLFIESEHDTSGSSAAIARVAERLHGKIFVSTTLDLSLAGEEGVQPPFAVVFNSLDEVKPVYQGKLELGPLLAFAEKASTPVIARLDLPAYIKYTQVLDMFRPF